LAVFATVVEIFTLQARKWLNFPTPPLFEAPARADPLPEFRDETYSTKTRGLPYGKNFTILTSAVFVLSTRVADRQTDGR